MGKLIGNLSNCVVHKINVAAIKEENLRNYYNKEFTTSFEEAKKYRKKINPPIQPFPEKRLVKNQEKNHKKS